MLQAIADGLLTGAIISLGAIGLTLTMGILRFANFAHAELMTFGARNHRVEHVSDRDGRRKGQQSGDPAERRMGCCGTLGVYVASDAGEPAR